MIRPVLSAVLLACLTLAGLLVQPASACGPDSDCVLGQRTYRIALPPNRGAVPIGALIFAHGYRGSAKGTMRNKSLMAFAHEHGLAYVAPKSASKDWLIPGVPENPAEDGSKEFDYFDALIDDLEKRHGIDRDRLIMSGFSAGGMMVWNLACHRGNRFRAFVPVAGTYWDPVPERCPTAPVNLVHIHGMTDKIVPVGGRPIAQTRQGDVRKALGWAQLQGKFGKPVQQALRGMECGVHTNPDAAVLAYCVHGGGHSIKPDYLRLAWDILRNGGVLWD